MENFLKKLEKKYPWGVIGTAIGLFFSLTGIYLTFREKTPEVTIDLLSEINVFDVHKIIDLLTIQFSGENIKETNQNLKILTFRIINSGDTDIRQNDFDQNVGWNLSVENGKIINVHLSGTTSSYIREQLTNLRFTDSTLVLPKMIFDRGQSFDLDVTVLHKRDLSTKAHLQGKISGIESFKEFSSFENSNRPNLIHEALYGRFSIQFLRLLVYFFGGLALLLLIIFSVDKISSKISLRKTNKRTSAFEQYRDFSEEPGLEVVSEVYIESGTKGLIALQKFLTSDSFQTEVHHQLEENQPNGQMLIDEHFLSGRVGRTEIPLYDGAYFDHTFPLVIQTLLKHKLITSNEGTANVSVKFTKLLENSIKKLPKL